MTVCALSLLFDFPFPHFHQTTKKKNMPPEFRINQHPILDIPERKKLRFFWKGQELEAFEDETIAAALFANGIHVFGYHPKDHSPQGIFCANGQCSQCLVIADGKPLKSCSELIQPNMHVEPMEGLPKLPPVEQVPKLQEIQELEVPVLIIGAGPAGLSAAIELGKLGIHCLLIDDKHRVGGKLVLQTHRFFGSVEAVHAGTRGIDIARILEQEVYSNPMIEVWTHSTALAVFSDKKVGVLKNGQQYLLIKPEILLVATGAREKSLAFKGNTLPGVFGAGAFQTLVNRDLVRPAENLFIIGGGNVGLIAGYHALQAGINVVGLIEAMPDCGGYKVHRDKLVRSGVPIYTSHTILSANGTEQVESVTIAEIDRDFNPIPATEKSFACDCVLLAVGLSPVDEFYRKAVDYGLKVFAAGDAEEIAEASAAIYAGKIRGREIAHEFGIETKIPPEWRMLGNILKSKPGKAIPEIIPTTNTGVLPILHCSQEIPCDPCTMTCAKQLIQIQGRDIRGIPQFLGDSTSCIHCNQCVAGCPGLAITVVDYRKDPENPIVSIPFEFNKELIKSSTIVDVMDTEGNFLGKLPILRIHTVPKKDKTLIVEVKAPQEYAKKIAGIRIQEESISWPLTQNVQHLTDDTIICRCERVTAGQIRQLIREGYRDINEIKAVTRAGMGACGGKTCTNLIYSLFRQEGIQFEQVTNHTLRPIFIEVPLEKFAGAADQEQIHD